MKNVTLGFICIFLFFQGAFSQEYSENTNTLYGQDLVQGLESYKIGAWNDALFFLKRSTSFQNATSDAAWYFAIMSEVHLGDYSSALRDGTTFLEIFDKSSYTAEITYQTLYSSYELGLYNQAIVGFSSFIEMYPTHSYVPAAIFYTGEALYNVYEFINARTYYEKIIVDYPNSTFYNDALFRLELLKQREREEKLLYLLRVTGEEAIATKEDYERQIKQLQSEESIVLRKRLEDLEEEYSKLLIEKEDLVIQNANLRNTVNELNSLNATKALSQESIQTETQSASNNNLIDDLSKKALELQKLLDNE